MSTVVCSLTLRLALPALFLALFPLAGCTDKAKAQYDQCVLLEQSYDVKGAAAACSAAVAADPNSTSGQAAAKKLEDLRGVEDKMATEERDKAAREARLQKDEPEALPTPRATVEPARTMTVDEVLEQARTMWESGDTAGAKALLEQTVLPEDGGKASPEVVRAMKKVCARHHDERCMAIVKKL